MVEITSNKCIESTIKTFFFIIFDILFPSVGSSTKDNHGKSIQILIPFNALIISLLTKKFTIVLLFILLYF